MFEKECTEMTLQHDQSKPDSAKVVTLGRAHIRNGNQESFHFNVRQLACPHPRDLRADFERTSSTDPLAAMEELVELSEIPRRFRRGD